MFSSIYGVDFSGAKLAGRNTWVARIEPASPRRRPRYTLTSLLPLERACGTAERSAALPHLVQMIAESDGALWALDFPFGLPVELMGPGACWLAQFDLLHAWGEDDYGVGLECIRRAQALGLSKHVRRLTDVEAKAPFDPYHYRIIYQTFYGMRDVLGPLKGQRHTAILPFQYRRLQSARRVLVEACPASTLKLLGLPHQNYKQPQGGRLAPKRLRTRRMILDGLSEYVQITEAQRRVMMRNGGGDALDAVVAAIGAVRSWQTSDHRLVARHPRYPREGRLFV
ncbi:MAG TPA: DUF429 domain-containing protein [Candidatus Binatia bacterium]|nr:DUF429 domain-containing protein [Candidatus Binatia bacterium]